jgi:PAS domain S-box-containing protein
MRHADGPTGNRPAAERDRRRTVTTATIDGEDLPGPGSLPLAALTAVLVFAAAFVGFRMQSDGIALIWPAAGIVTGVLAAAPRDGRRLVAAASCLAILLANLVEGRGLTAALVFTGANIGEAIAIVVLLDRFAGRPFRLDRPATVALFGAVVAGAAAAGGVATAVGLSAVGYGRPDVPDVALAWFLSHAVAVLAFAPAALHLPRLLVSRLPVETGDLAFGAAAAVLAAVVIASAPPDSIIAWIFASVLLVPLVGWVMLRPGPERAAAALLVIAVVTVWNTTGRDGLFSGSLAFAQAAVAAISGLLLMIGAVRPPLPAGLASAAASVRNPVTVVLLVPLMLFAAMAWTTWLSAAAEMRARLVSSTGALAGQVQRVLEVQEAALFAALGRVEGMPPDAIAGDRGVHDFLAALEGRMPTTESVFLYDIESDRVLATSRSFPAGGTSLADRDYVAAHRAGVVEHVGPAIRARVSGEIGFTLSRLSEDRRTVAVSLVSVGAIAPALREAREGPGDSVRLVRADGAVLAADPPAEPPIGARLEAGSAAMDLVGAMMPALVDGVDPRTGADVLIDVRRIGAWPVLVLAARERSGVVAAWIAALVPFALLAAGATVALYFLSVRLREAAGLAAAARLEARTQREIAVIAERLSLALAAARAGTWEWTPSGGSSLWSPENFDLFGIDPADGHPPFDRWVDGAVVPEDRERLRAAVRGALASGGDQFAFEFRIRHPRRGERWISALGRIERDAGGRATRLLGLNLDITAERRAVEALRRSEERYRLLFEASPNPMWVYDRETLRFLAVNAAAIARYGYSEDEFLAMRITEIRPPEEIPRLLEAVSRVEPRPASAGTWQHRARGGEIIHAMVTAQPIDFQDRKAVAVVVHDLTDRLRAEEALRESEARFRTMADHAPMMVWTTDATGARDYVAASWSAFTGLAEADGLGRGWLAAVHPADRAWVAALVDDPATRTQGFTAEYRMAHAEDGWRWVLDAAAPRAVGSGAFQGLIGSVVDITRRKEAEDDIQTLLREVNHRSKNLLAVVQAIARTTAASDPGEFVDLFTERLQALAASQDLLVASEWKGVELRDLVRVQLGHWRSEIGARIRLDGPRAQISAAAAQSLGMALHELGTNAGKYGALSTAEGTVSITWEISEDDPRGPRFAIVWTEQGGPPVTPPRRRGFGSTVVERLAAKALDADVEVAFDPAGLRWRLDAPTTSVLEPRRAA